MENTKTSKMPQIGYGLIAVGIIVLIINTGILNLETGLLLRFSPFIVAALGVFLLFGKRYGIIAGVILLIVGTMTSYFQPQILGGKTMNGELHTISQAFKGAKTATISINPSVAKLNISPLNSTELLIEGEISTHDNEKLITDSTLSNGHINYEIKTKKKNLLANINSKGDLVWNLKLNPSISSNLQISTGVGSATLDLYEFNLSKLKLKTGVGNAKITLSRHGGYDANIASGVGEITLKIPSELAIRIKVSKGVGSIKIDGSFTKQDNYYYSSNYDSSSNRVNLDINSGVGSITINGF
ncbi:MAG TPA: hypothetical protein ENK21_10575 [Trueperaceae bacterium]|nr:hypothetical protein [Trueperaceae bacterium]